MSTCLTPVLFFLDLASIRFWKFPHFKVRGSFVLDYLFVKSTQVGVDHQSCFFFFVQMHLGLRLFYWSIKWRYCYDGVETWKKKVASISIDFNTLQNACTHVPSFHHVSLYKAMRSSFWIEQMNNTWPSIDYIIYSDDQQKSGWDRVLWYCIFLTIVSFTEMPHG